jgi:N-acetylglucosaminyldiphosphoundecaprenol N-acetyl-beta-D-mannosaminyltransferase
MKNTQTLNGPAQTPKPLNIMGIPVVPFESYDQALECLERTIESNEKSLWVAINPVKIYRAWYEPEFLDLLRQIDVGICDGVGVSIASKILYGRSIKRCTGCDLFFKLLHRASQKGWGVYLLGASTQSNGEARSELQKIYPDLRIVGWHNGYFEDSRAVIEQINSSRADLLFVAMGSPKQEHWIWRYRQEIDAKFCMGVGGSLDIASGRLSRAPKVFRITGTEFLFRLIMEPRKRWSNQKILLSYFLRVIEEKLFGFYMLAGDREE